jgi:polar amino acid transport system substrate-binding protein
MRRWLFWGGLLYSLAASAGVPAQPDRLRICVSDHAYPPLTFPHRDGQAQYLIRRAAGQVGWRVEFVVLPWRRCLKAVTAGELEGVATVADTPTNRVRLAMPLLRGLANPSRAVGEVISVVIRRRDSRAEWDGVRFTGLHSPVIHEAGISAFTARLAELGQPGLDSANSPEQLMRMLLMGRAELALGLEPRISELLKTPEFADLQRLPRQFMQSNTYLAFNKALYAREKVRLDRVWQEIGRIRASSEWPQLAPRIYPGEVDAQPPRAGGGERRP